MNLPDFDTFRGKALAEGFAEVIERRWEPEWACGMRSATAPIYWAARR